MVKTDADSILAALLHVTVPVSKESPVSSRMKDFGTNCALKLKCRGTFSDTTCHKHAGNSNFWGITCFGFGGLEVASWPLIPKFAGSNPAEAVGFLRAKKSSARLPSEGK